MQSIIGKAVLLVPHLDVRLAQVVDGVGDVQEVLPELAGHVFVGRVVLGQLQRDGHKIQAIHAHPARSIGLLDVASGWEGRASVEDSDVIEPKEASLEYVSALGILAIHPPVEVEQQFMKYAFE